MSEEITAPRSVPPVVEHQSAGERDLSDLRREVIESRNLVIKTDNLLKNLHAELKHMGRKQEQFEKRHMATSVAAYILFAAIATLASLLTWLAIYATYRAPLWYAVLYPLGATMVAFIMLRSAWGRGRIEWRGRIYKSEAS